MRKLRLLLEMDGSHAFIVKKGDRGPGSPQRVDLVVLDPISPNGAQAAMEWFQKRDERNIRIISIDPIGTFVEAWAYEKAKPTVVDFDPPDEGGCVDIRLTLEFAKCSHSIFEY